MRRDGHFQFSYVLLRSATAELAGFTTHSTQTPPRILRGPFCRLGLAPPSRLRHSLARLDERLLRSVRRVLVGLDEQPIGGQAGDDARRARLVRAALPE